jgi:hypothetical protein
MNQYMNGLPMSIFGDGEQKRAFSFIDDCLEPLWKAAVDKKASKEIINLGSSVFYTINEANSVLREVIGDGTYIHKEGRHEVKDAHPTWTKSIELLDYKDKTLLYEFIIKPIKKNALETKCHIKKIAECSKDEFKDKLKEVKKPLIKNLQDENVHKNLILFTIHHSSDYPLKETLLPIAKRKIMNYMIQSKIIKHKNLTNKL